MQWWMAIICGIVYAMVELARVPLAVCAATHRKWYARWLAIFMLMFAVVITTKSLSQIGEQMFSQRLVEVHKAQTELEVAEANNRGPSRTTPPSVNASRRSTPRSKSC